MIAKRYTDDGAMDVMGSSLSDVWINSIAM